MSTLKTSPYLIILEDDLSRYDAIYSKGIIFETTTILYAAEVVIFENIIYVIIFIVMSDIIIKQLNNAK